MQRALAVYNNSGGSLAKDKVVYSTGYRRPSQLNAVALASAAASSTTTVIGVMLRAVLNNTVGQVVFAGDITADTSGYSAVGSKVYLSDTPGEFQTTAGTVSTVIGLVKVKAVAGTITILCQPVLSP